MRGLVLDASIFLDILLNNNPAEEIIALTDQPLHAPTLLDYEFTSGARKNARRSTQAREESEEALRMFSALTIERHDARPLMPRMWSLRDTITAYDASYVALAEALDLPLVTSDLRLARAAAPYCEVITPAEA